MNNKIEVNKQLVWAGVLVLFLSLVFNIGQIAKQNALRGSIDRFSYGLSIAQNDQQASAALDRFMTETGPKYYSSSQAKINWKFWTWGRGASDPHSDSYTGSGRCNAWMAGGECIEWNQ